MRQNPDFHKKTKIPAKPVTPDVEALTKMVMHSRDICRTGMKTDGIAPTCIGFQFANGRGSGFAMSFNSDAHYPTLIAEFLVNLALAFDLHAFAVVQEAWMVKYNNVSTEMVEGMKAMQERGSLPPPSKHPERMDCLLLRRGDLNMTQEGHAELDAEGQGEIDWEDMPAKGAPDGIIKFGLEAFDAETKKRGAEKLGLNPDAIRALARQRLEHNLPEGAFDVLVKMSEMPPKTEGKK